MKKSVHVIITFISIALFCNTSIAQTGTTNQKHAEALKIHQQKRTQALATAAPKQVKTTNTFQVDETDPYQGRKEEFLSLLTVKELPSDFPKYNKSYGIDGYNKIVEDFLVNHKSIVIESVKRKFEAQGK